MSEYFEIEDQPDIRGLRFRGYRGEEDLTHFHAISQKEIMALDFDILETLDDYLLSYKHMVNCDPFIDILVAEIDGSIVGYSRVYWSRKVQSGYNYNNFAVLDPDWYGKGIREAMVVWNENRLREIARQHPDTETKEFQTWSLSNEDVWISLIESRGYKKVRYGYTMTRPLTGEIPTAAQHPLPEGLELRPVTPEHYRKVWDSDIEASKDGWQMTEHTEEHYKRWSEQKEFQPEKWQIAWDIETNEVAGAVQPFINEEENKKYDRLRGYTEYIHVSRKWRGQGVAKSLIASSFQVIKDLGMEQACLGVDAENPTGALNLYTAMGFKPDKTFFTFRKGL